jgi:diacylglycerol kinase (ATP)
MFTYHIKRFLHPIRGILYAVKRDRSFRMQVYGIASLLAIATYFLKPLSQTEILFFGVSYALILITELQNSAFEAALDKLHPELHDAIGKSKDMAAGAVLIAGFFLLFVLTVTWIL